MVLAKHIGDDGVEDTGTSPSGKQSTLDAVSGRPPKLSALTHRSPQHHDWQVDLSTPAKTTESFQSFFSMLEDEITSYWNAAGSPTMLGRRRGSDKKTAETNAAAEDEEQPPSQTHSHISQDGFRPSSSEKGSVDKQIRVRKALDAVERVVCGLFYDKIFAPEGSDDQSHDKALSSRVAALNMLDLSLDHLGVEVAEESMTGVEQVVQAVGRG